MKDVKRTKTYWILGIIIFLIIAIYLNRGYSYIYDTIGLADLKKFDLNHYYMISGYSEATSSLKYVALGDSLTAGVGANRYEDSWPYLLAQKLAGENKNIILRAEAVPGYKTVDVISELLEPAIKENPDFLTVLIGVNDIHNQVSATDFRKNYENILNRLIKETKAKIYIINLPYIGSDKLIEPPYNSYFNRQTQEFNEIIKKLASKYQLKYIDLYTASYELFKKSGDHYSPDLFHPSATGYKIWAGIIYDNINK